MPTGTSVTHTEAGVTWTFDSTVTYGHYINGEPYVLNGAGDITITGVTPAGTSGARDKHGVVVQPADATGNEESFDSELSGYNSSHNKDPDFVGANLVIDIATYPNGASVVKAVSLDSKSSFTWIDKFSVLTVVGSAPAADSFRPPITGTTKTSSWDLTDVDFTKLKSLTPVTNQPVISDYSFMEGAVFVSWRGGGGSAYRDMHPDSWHDGYGAYQKGRYANIMMAMHGNESNATKQALLVTLVQAGIDYCGGADLGLAYSTSSAHNDDYKILAVLAATMLGDAGLTTSAQTSGAFAEDSFIEDLAAPDIGSDYIYKNASNFRPGTGCEYQSVQQGVAEWRLDNLRPDPNLNANYRSIYWATAPIISLVFEMLGTSQEGRTKWGHEPFFEYAFRCQKMFEVDRTPVGGSSQPSQPQMDFWATHFATYTATTTTLPPEAPLGITVTDNAGDLDVAVTGSQLPGTSAITQVDYRHSTDLATWTEHLNAGNSHTITGLTDNTHYYVQARYVNAVGNGPWSLNHVIPVNSTVESITGLSKGDANYESRLDDIRTLNPGDESLTVQIIQGVAATGVSPPQPANERRPTLTSAGLIFPGIL